MMTENREALSGEVQGRPRSRVSSLGALGALSEVIDAASECFDSWQLQRTERTRIAANAEVAIERIHAGTDIMKSYFTQVFAERGQNFDRLFDSLDSSIEQGDREAASAALDAIVNLAKQSPIAELADLPKVRAAFENPEHEWDL